MEKALEAGADDVEREAGFFTVTGAPDTFAAIGEALQGYATESSDVTFIPKDKIMLSAGDAKKMIQIIDAIEELDDVQSAITNADIPDEVMAELGD